MLPESYKFVADLLLLWRFYIGHQNFKFDERLRTNSGALSFGIKVDFDEASGLFLLVPLIIP